MSDDSVNRFDMKPVNKLYSQVSMPFDSNHYLETDVNLRRQDHNYDTHKSEMNPKVISQGKYQNNKFLSLLDLSTPGFQDCQNRNRARSAMISNHHIENSNNHPVNDFQSEFDIGRR